MGCRGATAWRSAPVGATLTGMGTLTEVSEWIAEKLPILIERYDVPGAAVAVLAGGDVIEHAAGELSVSTGVEAMPESVFQIGSITKLWDDIDVLAPVVNRLAGT